MIPTDGQGRFTIPLVPPAKFIAVPVIKNTYCQGSLVTVGPGATQQVTLVVGDGRAIVGRFLWSEPGGRIRWESPNELYSLTCLPSPSSASALTETAKADDREAMLSRFEVEPNGSFRLEAVPDEAYRLVAWIKKDPPEGSPQIMPISQPDSAFQRDYTV